MKASPNCQTLRPGVCAFPSASVDLKKIFRRWSSSASARSTKAGCTSDAQLEPRLSSRTVLSVNTKSSAVSGSPSLHSTPCLIETSVVQNSVPSTVSLASAVGRPSATAGTQSNRCGE